MLMDATTICELKIISQQSLQIKRIIHHLFQWLAAVSREVCEVKRWLRTWTCGYLPHAIRYPSTPLPHHAQLCAPGPPIRSINKPEAGPRQRIMVHLEVTAKENRALCITNRDIDKPTGALRNLDKGLFTHVRNWIHFLVGLRAEAPTRCCCSQINVFQVRTLHPKVRADCCVPFFKPDVSFFCSAMSCRCEVDDISD